MVGMKRGMIPNLLFLGAALLLMSSCTNPPASAETQKAGGDVKAETSATSKPVAKIVFVDKENCCKCTGERTEKSWSALQAALKAKSAAIPVERIHFDTQADQTAKYTAMKPMVAIPAVYFLDADGGLIEMLQGEVTQAQVEKVL